MSDNTAKPLPPHRGVKKPGKPVTKLFVRMWAFVILLVIGWTAYAAASYMVEVVFTPAKLPPDMAEWQASIPAAALRAASARGTTSAFVRAPLKHYHAVDRWFQPDQHNNCTTSGCHEPLAHTRHKETRAFANLHATFMACEMCHSTDAQAYQRAVWVSTATGQPQQPPAILQLMRDLALNVDQVQNQPADVHSMIVHRLRSSLSVIGGDPMLEYFLLQIETSEPGSPMWRQTVAQLTAELPHHARGEYAAKLALPQSTTQPSVGSMADLTRQYLAAIPEDPRRKQLHDQIHGGVLVQPDSCLHCHGQRPEGMDFDAAGYWPARAQELSSLSIAGMIQNIRQGQPFHFPRVLRRGGHTGSPPATQP